MSRCSAPLPIQRSPDRRGHANGFKPKTLATRVGEVQVQAPQTRGYHDEQGRPFYPRARLD